MSLYKIVRIIFLSILFTSFASGVGAEGVSPGFPTTSAAGYGGVRYLAFERKHEIAGLEYAIHGVRAYVPADVLAERYVDVPSLVDASLIIVIDYSVSNEFGESLPDASRFGTVSAGNPDDGSVRKSTIRDYAGVIASLDLVDGMSHNVHSVRVGFDGLSLDDVTWLRWEFLLDGEVYSIELELLERVTEFRDQEVDIKYSNGQIIQSNGVDFDIERILILSSGMRDYQALYPDAKALVFVVVVVSNPTNVAKAVFPQNAALIVLGDDAGNVINFGPYLQRGMGFGSASGLLPDYVQVDPGKRIYFGAWLPLAINIDSVDEMALYLGCVFNVTPSLEDMACIDGASNMVITDPLPLIDEYEPLSNNFLDLVRSTSLSGNSFVELDG